MVRMAIAALALAMAAWAAGDKSKDRGRELVEDVCTYCHSLNKLNGQHMSREQWSNFIKGMISEGAPVTDEEFSLIVDYLAKNFGNHDREK